MRRYRILLTLPAMLFAVSSPGSQERAAPPDTGQEGACLECHGELARGPVVHGAVEAESCDICHVATGEGHHFEVAAPVAEVCLECHDDPREEGGKVHGPAAAGECTSCHDPHRSDVASLLRWAAPDLCWSCHGRVLDRPGSEPPVRNVQREIAEAATVHGALEAGCDICHPAHASSREGLFIDSFPAGPYAAGPEGSYELCFGCHEPELFGEDPRATEFRDGERNLHRVHVAQPKSRSCALCHSPHGGSEHLLRSSVRFGSWSMPLTWEPTPAGGSCAPACHEKRFYERPVGPSAAGPGQTP